MTGARHLACCVRIPAMADGDSGVSNLERSAFWIYGVTAMIMREPMSTLLRHGSTAGWGDPLIRVETLRVLVVLVFLSRLFLAAGLHFEIVFMRPESAKLFPKRSYPVDFLAGLGQLLVGVAASTVVSLHPAGPDGVAIFNFLAGSFLLADVLWLVVTALLGYSALREVARRASLGAGILALSLAFATLTRVAGAGPVIADEVMLLSMLLLSSADAAMLIGRYTGLGRTVT